MHKCINERVTMTQNQQEETYRSRCCQFAALAFRLLYSLVILRLLPSARFPQRGKTLELGLNFYIGSHKIIYLYPLPVLRTACTNTPLLATAVYTHLTFHKQKRPLSDGAYGGLIKKNKIYMRMKEYEKKNMTTHTRSSIK